MSQFWMSRLDFRCAFSGAQSLWKSPSLLIDSRGVRHDVVQALLRIALTYSWNVSSACTFLFLPLKTS